MKTMSKILTVIALVVLCVSLFTLTAFADAPHDAISASVEGDTLTHVPSTTACGDTGPVDHWECTHGIWYDANEISDAHWIDGTNKPTTETVAHSLTHVEKKDATCQAAGTEEYWKCSKCGKMFSDEAGTTEITEPKAIDPLGHKMNSVAESKATCQHEGNIAYKVCERCGAIQDSNDNFLKSMDETKIAKTDHDWGTGEVVKQPTDVNSGIRRYKCKNCDATKDEVIPATGVPAATDKLYPLIASRDTYYRGEELPQFWSDLIGKLNKAGGGKVNLVGVRIGTSQSLYANGYDTLDFWSSGNTITLGENMVKNLDAGTYYVWVYNKNDPNEHTDSIPWYIVDVPTLEPINTDKHVINSTKNLRFRASEPVQAGSVKVGGKSLYDANYYYVSNDGLTITLSPDFLNERQAGTYTISANTVANGTKVSCPFYILSTASGSSASPKTADESQLGLWAAFLLLSGAAVVVLVPKIRKHGV